MKKIAVKKTMKTTSNPPLLQKAPYIATKSPKQQKQIRKTTSSA